jgi:hypothetical protein
MTGPMALHAARKTRMLYSKYDIIVLGSRVPGGPILIGSPCVGANGRWLLLECPRPYADGRRVASGPVNHALPRNFPRKKRHSEQFRRGTPLDSVHRVIKISFGSRRVSGQAGGYRIRIIVMFAVAA